MAGGGTPDSGGGPPLQWPLVGRHEELDQFAASLADDRAHGFVIHGAAGAGKTRLADQCLALAAELGRNVARATASEGSRDVPLGALAHLLPRDIAGERCDLVAVMSEVRPVLLEGASGGPLVLFVDDLHRLDATSATLIAQLVDADLIFLVATVRSGEAVPSGLDSLWQRARVRRIDLEDLDRAAVDTLLHLVLGGPVEARTVADIWEVSEGNVLFIREVVLGAVATERLVDQRGVWRLVGPFVTTPRLRDLIESRLGALGAEVAGVLDALAVWEPVGLSMLEAMVGGERLEELDRAGILAVRTDGRRQELTLAHPLYGEILRDRIPSLTRRRLLGELVDRVQAHGARRREDAIRLATASLEATGSADGELLARAARLARYGQDFGLVERLGRAALRDGLSPELGLLVGEALHERGAFDEADELLRSAEASATDRDGELLVHITEIHSRNLMWGLLRPEDALVVNRRVLDRLSGGPGAEELLLNEAMLLTYSGKPRESLAVLESQATPSDPRADALRALARVPALVAVGKVETAVQEAQAAFVLQVDLPDQIAIPGPGIHIINQCWALAECGRLAEAATLAAAAYEATPATAPPDGLLWLAHQQGRAALLAGRLETARRWLGEALARCEEHDVALPRRLVLAALATAHGGLGDADAARAAVTELDRLAVSGFVETEPELGRAWALVAEGDLPGARSVLARGADRASDIGHLSTEAWLLHDIARLGDPESVTQRLGDLALECEGDLVAAYAAHAAAATTRDPDGLLSATDGFERLGALLLAAEAANEAAQAFQRDGQRRASTAAATRSAALGEHCEGARTPGLTAVVAVVPLTGRERDIARLAAQGASSKEIAERLYLSVRTVDNHLQSAYSKLGVGGRRELAGALAELTDSPAPPH